MIVIPMAGLSSRFLSAGYTRPKYMLELYGRTLFDLSVSSFRAQFATTDFLFIYRDLPDVGPFIDSECRKLGLKRYQAHALSAPTRGQAETVALGLDGTGGQAPLTIFNIDTIRLNYRYRPLAREIGGRLEVFRGEGENWSFVKEDPSLPGRVVRTTEKDRISDLCSTGLYEFSSVDLFQRTFERFAPKELAQGKELYVAPMYNSVIAGGDPVVFDEIDRRDVVFSGVPAEYEALLHASPLNPGEPA